MTCSEIIKDYLIKNKFDGLGCEACSCDIEDLMPCNEFYGDCKPGYKVSCDCGQGCEFHIKYKEE